MLAKPKVQVLLQESVAKDVRLPKASLFSKLTQVAAPLAAAFQLVLGHAHADSVSVRWDANPPSDRVDNYIVHLGPRPGVYTEKYSAGTQTRLTIDNLEPNRVYYSVVTAHRGNESSEPSDEIHFVPVSQEAGSGSSGGGGTVGGGGGGATGERFDPKDLRGSRQKLIIPEISVVAKGSAELPSTMRNNGAAAVKIDWSKHLAFFDSLKPGQTASFETSGDMKAWVPLQTITLGSGGYLLGDKKLVGRFYASLLHNDRRYYRIRVDARE